jgi:hypothetical protein
MKPEEFVAVVSKRVMAAAVDDTIRNLEQPPGRRPAPELVALSEWYLRLAPDTREMVGRALALASRAAVFGFFAVLDGARRVDPAQPPGELQLWYQREELRTLLSGDLHVLLTSTWDH